ncbi:GntR family transcriptional regulator [Leucobacter sp. NPDC015123]|uniref:GntR family transcriptional regulator n=1 Tax=Leucobacter sp. NPDC015123 TaxID=3364129 RepID=UPI0036F48522
MSTQPSPSRRLTPLKRPLNLRETVLEQLRTAIITGEIAEGSLVSAPTLGQALGVSATPVREAMMDLAREGLVETIKNKGFRITAMTDKELDDLAAIRLLLEPPSMPAAIGRLSDEDFEELERLADACLTAAETEDLQGYLGFDREFHHFILSHIDNPQLTELATSLRTRTRLYGLKELASKGRLGDSAREHHTLIALLRAGDGAGAEQLMRDHIGHARRVWATGSEEHDTQDGVGS